MRDKKALVMVDVQYDFLPGGALGVANGDRVVPPLSWLARLFVRAGLPVFATRDWHPPETVHFVTLGGPWPPHCVQGTHGAEFPAALHMPEGTIVVSKGMRPDEDAYSAFQAMDDEGKLLPDLLRAMGAKHIVLGGLATDYCVLQTTKDALAQGFEVTVLADAVAAVDVRPGDGDRALAEMIKAGAHIATSSESRPLQ